MNGIDWNLARAFCATADAGSLSAAARKIGLTQPTLSRQVAELEAELGVALFERIGKKLVLTSTGRGLLEHARVMAAAADAMVLSAAGQMQEITGRVCISATDAFSAYILPDIVERIRRQAPQITISIIATDSLSDLRRREADIAIRHLRPTEPELIARHIGEMHADFYASSIWVTRHGKPTTAKDLTNAEVLAFEPVDRFVDQLGRSGIALSADQCCVVSDNAIVLWELVRRGLGVGMMLREVAARTPDLVRLLPDWEGIPVPVWLVTHGELRTSARVRLVFDVVAEELSNRLGPGHHVNSS
jgi:DNA-binding transcriptional LysR family regulator